MIVVFDNKWTINPNGFINNSNICYLNSILQALLGCTIFNNYITKVKHNNLQIFYDLLINKNNVANFKILEALKLQYSNTNNEMFHGQEDVSEVYLLILDYFQLYSLSENIDTIFGLDYDKKITCYDCKTNKLLPSDKSYMINIPANFNKNIIEYLMINVQKLSEYKCEHCNKTENMYQWNILSNAPYVITFTFNKYYQKHNITYPTSFILKNKFKYKLVSDIQHYGTINSGHYTSRSIRRNNKIYAFNDQHVMEANLEPLDATYMLFYHFEKKINN